MLFATTSKGVVKALKRREPQKHKEELFSSFVLFVPLWFKAFMLLRQPRRWESSASQTAAFARVTVRGSFDLC